MTSNAVPLGCSTKNSPMGTVSSSTTSEMLRSWVIITKFRDRGVLEFLAPHVPDPIWLGLQIRYPVAGDIERASRDQTQACRCRCSGNRGLSKPPRLQCHEFGRLLRYAWPALHRGKKGSLPVRSYRARDALSLLGCRRAYGATR